MPTKLTTEKHRIRRHFFDHQTGNTYDAIAHIPGRRAIDERALPIFLRIGYVPGHATLFAGVDCLPGGCEIEADQAGWRVRRRFGFADLVDRAALAKLGRRELAVLGARTFVEAVASSFNRADRIVVPLSGGMDSRAILGALLEMVDASQLNTYTYGLPGTNDYEIGNLVARVAGTRHTAINQTDFEFDEARLERVALLTDANTDLMQPAIWLRVLGIFGSDAQFWTGFTGDGLGGSHFREGDGDVEDAVRMYVDGETRDIAYLRPDEWKASDAWPVARETKYDGVLSRREAIWFENHVERYTAHHIFLNGVEYVNPFMDDRFAAFMLGVPPACRRDKSLFDEMMSLRFPQLFELPTKDHGYRLARRKVRHAAWWIEQSGRKMLWRLTPALVRHPRTSYIDFAHAIRHRSDVQAVVRSAFASLCRRGLLESRRLERMLDAHLHARANYAPTITLLTSLEIAIRAFCEASPQRQPSALASAH